MTTTAKLLGIYALLGVGLVFLGVPVIFTALGVVGATVLTQAIVHYLKPKTPQEETMHNLGFTGLSLGPSPKSKETQDGTASN
jgi:hypothetical protein